MDPFADVLAANADYRRDFGFAELPPKAGRGLVVITCMDSRLAPLEMLGLGPGDAYVLRNAGGRVTDEVLATLALATQLLGVERVMVVAHTDCRMAKATEEQVHADILAKGVDTRSLEFRTTSDQSASLRRDVQRIRSSPYLPAGLPVVGCFYDVSTGAVEVAVPVEESETYAADRA